MYLRMICMYVWIYTCVCTYVCLLTDLCICICVHIYIYAYIYIHIHTHIYVCIYIYIYMCIRKPLGPLPPRLALILKYPARAEADLEAASEDPAPPLKEPRATLQGCCSGTYKYSYHDFQSPCCVSVCPSYGSYVSLLWELSLRFFASQTSGALGLKLERGFSPSGPRYPHVGFLKS